MTQYRIYRRAGRTHHATGVLRKELRGGIRTPESPTQRRGSVIVNYGCSTVPNWRFEYEWVNHPTAVATSSNKLMTLNALKEAGVDHVQYTTDIEEARSWFSGGRNVRVYQRSNLRGHSGSGISVVESPDDLTRVPLYTRRFPAGREFRIHVCLEESPVVVQKRPMSRAKLELLDIEDADPTVRNHANGWVYSENVNLPDDRRGHAAYQAIKAIEACGLDYGAVDMLYSVQQDRFAVCEVNSAPGMLDQRTQDFYIRGIKNIYG